MLRPIHEADRGFLVNGRNASNHPLEPVDASDPRERAVGCSREPERERRVPIIREDDLADLTYDR